MNFYLHLILTATMSLAVIGCCNGVGGAGQPRCGFVERAGLLVLEDINCAYPVYAHTFRTEYEAAINVRQGLVELVAGTTTERDVRNLYEQLDQLNMDVRNNIIAAYQGYVTALSASPAGSPERARAQESFERQQQNILELTRELREIVMQARAARVDASAVEVRRVVRQGNELFQKAEQMGYH